MKACGLEILGPSLESTKVGTAAVFSAKSPVRESGNEDALAVLPIAADGLVMIVADGVGGERDGAAAARTCIESIAVALESRSEAEGSIRAAIVDGIEKANETIRGTGTGGATTVAVVAVQGRRARPIHVGDSAILVMGQRGKIKHQAIAHGPVGYAVEAGVLGEREALHHDERNVVSNVVGSESMRIEIGPELTLAPRDTVLVASDGLSDNLFVDEIVALVRKGPLQPAADKLASRCRQRMEGSSASKPSKPDDLTFVLFRPVAATAPPTRRRSSP